MGADALVEFPPHGINEYVQPIKIDGVITGEFLPSYIYYTLGNYQRFYKDFTRIFFTSNLTFFNKI